MSDMKCIWCGIKEGAGIHRGTEECVDVGECAQRVLSREIEEKDAYIAALELLLRELSAALELFGKLHSAKRSSP